MLEGILFELGGKALSKIIGKKFGPEMGDLTKVALDTLGEAFGVEPKEDVITRRIEEVRQADPQQAKNAVAYAEANIAAELLAQAELQRAGNDQQKMTNELLMAQMKQPGWRSDWLPAWQWFLMAAWAWTIFVAPVANAVIRISTGQSAAEAPSVNLIDVAILVTLTGLFLSLHMGGHTILELMRNQWGGLFGKKGGAAGE